MPLSRAELHALLDSLPEDEPVYLLRGADPSAGTALRAWARQHRRVGGGEASALAVEAVAKNMDAWARTHSTSSPTPKPPGASPEAATKSLQGAAVIYSNADGYPGDSLPPSQASVLSSRDLGEVTPLVEEETGAILVSTEDLVRLRGQLRPEENLILQTSPTETDP